MSQELVFKVLLAPHVSEKSTIVGDQSNQYVFKVAREATKPQIKRAVEKLFEVSVEQVRVLNVQGKTKRFGQRMGSRGDWKKAYVTLKSGQEIDFMGGD